MVGMRGRISDGCTSGSDHRWLDRGGGADLRWLVRGGGVLISSGWTSEADLRWLDLRGGSPVIGPRSVSPVVGPQGRISGGWTAGLDWLEHVGGSAMVKLRGWISDDWTAGADLRWFDYAGIPSG